jgi:hypothetical protein
MWEETAYEADERTIGVRDLLALKPHLFSGETGHHMDSALLYPMLAAFRAMIKVGGSGGPQWIGGFSNVLAVWRAHVRLQVAEFATLDRRHFTVVRPVHVSALTLLPRWLAG